jgi:two-component system chemotaxis response regulator CheV
VEMPVMDGYTLTTKIRRDPDLANLHIILHTSLSGVFNQSMIEKVGADAFLAKYEPDELARVVQARLKQHKLEVQAQTS